MATGITIEIQDAEALSVLAVLEQRLEDLHPVLDAIGAKIEGNVKIRFDLGQDPTGAAWSPLKPSTIKSYQKKYPNGIPGSLLNRTGGNQGLMGSLSYVVDGDSVRIGFGQEYALYHEFGTSKMVRRGM